MNIIFYRNNTYRTNIFLILATRKSIQMHIYEIYANFYDAYRIFTDNLFPPEEIFC